MARILKVSAAIFGMVLFVLLGILILLRPTAPFSQFPAATKTSSGHPGDPINIAFLGTKEELTNAFVTADWLIPDETNATSTAHIITTSVLNAPYPTAPVSDLFLFGRTQDLAFELPMNTVRVRHHVRLWQTTESIASKPLWIGSASYDTGLELSGVTKLPTHHISPNVDGERSFLAKSLEGAGVARHFSNGHISLPTLWGFNGGGDWYFDDGVVEVLILTSSKIAPKDRPS